MKRYLIGSAALAFAMIPAAIGQQATGLIRVGDAVPSVGPGQVVVHIDGLAVNGVGGYSAVIFAGNGTTELSAILGNATGGPATTLRVPKSIAGYEQTFFQQEHSLSDSGVLSYAANSASSFATAVFEGDTLIAAPDQPIPGVPGYVWSGAYRPEISRDGSSICWLGGYKNATTGANGAHGLFRNNLLVAQSGLPVDGMPFPPTSLMHHKFSAQSTNHVFLAHKDAWPQDEYWVVANGAAIPTSAGYVALGHPIPPENGGRPGELWWWFRYLGISESGETFLTGSMKVSEFGYEDYVARDGKIIYRDGTVLSGLELTGYTFVAAMNEQGDIAHQSAFLDGLTYNMGLFLNNKLLLREGDLVDADGDGVAESILTDFTQADMVIGEDRTIYFTADFDVPGPNDLEALFSITDPCGPVRTYGAGCAGTAGQVPQLGLDGCAQAGGNVSLEVHRALGGSSALIFFAQGRASTAINNACYLNLSGILPSPLVLPVDPAGRVSIPATIPANTPQVSFTMQAFSVDPASSIGAAASNGLEVVIVP